MLTINKTTVPTTMFPDHTSQVWKLPTEILKASAVSVTWEFDYEGEFLHLAQLKSLLDAHGVEAILHLPYLPYGRQDKEVSNDATFALVTFASLLNHLNFQSVTISDPHSKRALELIDRSHGTYPRELIKDLVRDLRIDLICYPDEGARVKYGECYASENFATIHGEKVRDQATGYITSYKLNGNPADGNVLIVDDICDGGATFVLLARDLLKAGASTVTLFVTHGIFSKGLHPLKEAGIKRIFTNKGEAVVIDKHTVGYIHYETAASKSTV